MPTLYDHRGRPVDLGALREVHAAPAMAGVRPILSTHPARGLTPQRLAAILLQAEEGDAEAYLALAEDMEERHLRYFSVLGTRKRAVVQLALTVEAASDAADDVRAADLVRAMLEREGLEDDLFDVLDAIGKGYSVAEITWELSAREWRPARIEWRDPRWFAFDLIDGTTLRLREGAQLVELAPFKYVVHVAKAKSGLPIRGGLARAAGWAWLFANYALKDWVAFAEVFGQPYRVGKYTPGATADDRAALLRAVASIGSDAAAIMPASMQLEFLETDRGGATDVYKTLCDYLDGRVAEAVLGQTLTTDVSSNGGSRALGDVHNEVRNDIRRSDVQQLERTLQRDLVRPLVDLNLGPRGRYPRLRLGMPNALPAGERLDRIYAAVDRGLQVEASVVRDILGVPEPAPDADVLARTAPAAPPAPPAGGARAPLARAAAARTMLAAPPATPLAPAPPSAALALAAGRPATSAAPGDAIDHLVAAALEDAGWEPLVAPMVAPIAALLGDADSLEAFRDRLVEQLAAMDVTALTDALERALATATIAGRAGAPTVDEATLRASADSSAEPGAAPAADAV